VTRGKRGSARVAVRKTGDNFNALPKKQQQEELQNSKRLEKTIPGSPSRHI